MPNQRDKKLMRAALQEARKGLGHTSPNPAVGAVLTLGNKILARGHHHRAGRPHAEIECLRAWKKTVPRRAVLYITLEPCSTKGRTAPCTHELISRGVKNVVVGAIDPNPRHRGRGLQILRAAGINVRSGVLEDECLKLNEPYNKWIETRRPFVIAKCGMSLDGRLTGPPGDSRWLTSRAARNDAQRLRGQVDAILIGAETLRVDDPRLTARLTGARQPWRVIVTRSGKLPKRAKIFRDRFAGRTLVYRGKTLEQVLLDLGRREITSVLIEGGGDVLGQALDARLIDKVQIYVAPVVTGGPVIAFAGRGAGATTAAFRLTDIGYGKIENDVSVSGRIIHLKDAGE